MSQRSIQYNGDSIEILYIQQLTDRVSLMDFVIKPLSIYIEHTSDTMHELKAETFAQNVLHTDDCKLQTDEEEAKTFVLDGKVVILLPDADEYIVVNLKKVEHRAISDPMIEYTLRAPRDCFVENLDTNLSLIRVLKFNAVLSTAF